MKQIAIALIIPMFVFVSACGDSEEEQESKFRAEVARDVEREKVKALNDSLSPSKILEMPTLTEAVLPPQLQQRPAINIDRKQISDQLECDQMRRDIDSLKRQAEMERMNREIQQRADERRAAQKDREHFLGLDHLQ